MEEYFFGTGGLVRAYSDALQKAIENSNIVEKELGYIAEFMLNYSDSEKFKYYCSQNNLKIVNTEFEENVKFTIEISKENYAEIIKQKEELKFKIIKYEITKESYIKI